jgi:type II pantothenate kinase
MLDVSGITERVVAIDFGASNTDAVAVIDGKLRVWSQRSEEILTIATVQAILAAGDVEFSSLELLAVTGGHHQALPDQFGRVQVVKVAELPAIARGGQALAVGRWDLPQEPMLIVSAGSGTAMVAARERTYQHVTGTGVGGGTLLGLGRLLLGTIDPVKIDQMAQAGKSNGADLSIQDIVTGPIGALPADATAINFGRIARLAEMPSQDDLAAALVTMVGQVIATLAVNAARAARVERVVVTGHLTDMQTMYAAMERVGAFFGLPLDLFTEAGYATVTGAMLHALKR